MLTFYEWFTTVDNEPDIAADVKTDKLSDKKLFMKRLNADLKPLYIKKTSPNNDLTVGYGLDNTGVNLGVQV